MKPSLDDLSPPQRTALTRFARRNGRCWKARLGSLWASGRDEQEAGAAYLRQIRNERGPRWLTRIVISH